jgi:uncharacterized secreted protein with C-terminal beta-propeller domain
MRIGRRALVLGSAVLATTVVAGAAVQPSATGAAAAPSTRLVAFHSCGDFLGYVKARTTPLVGAYGLGVTAKGPGPVPAVPTAAAGARESGPQEGVDYSGTNVQEQGVDEPDIVKTDGTTLYAVANGKLDAVDVSAGKPRLLDTLKLDGGWSHELLLHGDRLIVLSRGGYWIEPMPAVAARMMPFRPSQSVLTEVDVSDPKALRVVRTLTLDGSYLTARLVGGAARIVVSSQVPGKMPFETPAGTSQADIDAATAANKKVVASSRALSWLPSYRLARPGHGAGKSRALVQCRNVRRPAAFSGLGMMTVLTIDVDRGLEPVDSVGVMTDARIVYAAPSNLYVATERWSDRPDPNAPTDEQQGVLTAIHRFDISGVHTQYRGSGQVPGFLLSQWSLSENRGVLRVVSTETPAWWGSGAESESYLTTLRLENGALVKQGQVGGLGRGERVYAVRFVGDVGYVVTFRQIDPVYTIDVSNPDAPRVLGELKIPGFSSYLHPVGDDLILGIGEDADANGRPLGTEVSLFDVSDLRHPKRLDQLSLGAGWTEAAFDHHAFLYWPRTGLAVLPFEQKAVGLRVGRAHGIEQLGRVVHGAGNLQGTPTIRRALVAGGSLLTVSDAGVKASTMDTLSDRGWTAFPPPSPGPVPVPG